MSLTVPSDIRNLPPGDTKLIECIMNHLKSQGIFDQFRRDCLADVDTKPGYLNLRQRVDGFVGKYLSDIQWKPDLNKNLLRESVRRQINESGLITTGVDRILDQVVNPKIYHTFLPKITMLVNEFLGIETPPINMENLNKVNMGSSPALLPTPILSDGVYISGNQQTIKTTLQQPILQTPVYKLLGDQKEKIPLLPDPPASLKIEICKPHDVIVPKTPDKLQEKIVDVKMENSPQECPVVIKSENERNIYEKSPLHESEIKIEKHEDSILKQTLIKNELAKDDTKKSILEKQLSSEKPTVIKSELPKKEGIALSNKPKEGLSKFKVKPSLEKTVIKKAVVTSKPTPPKPSKISTDTSKGAENIKSLKKDKLKQEIPHKSIDGKKSESVEAKFKMHPDSAKTPLKEAVDSKKVSKDDKKKTEKVILNKPDEKSKDQKSNSSKPTLDSKRSDVKKDAKPLKSSSSSSQQNVKSNTKDESDKKLTLKDKDRLPSVRPIKLESDLESTFESIKQSYSSAVDNAMDYLKSCESKMTENVIDLSKGSSIVYNELPEGTLSQTAAQTKVATDDENSRTKIEDDAKSTSYLSDVTVSSVHTSDLSDFDDHITLSDIEEEKSKKQGLEFSGSQESNRDAKIQRARKRRKTEEILQRASEKECEGEPRVRRQRKLNPKYASEEFSSIFSKNRDRSKSIEGDGDSEGNTIFRSKKLCTVQPFTDDGDHILASSSDVSNEPIVENRVESRKRKSSKVDSGENSNIRYKFNPNEGFEVSEPRRKSFSGGMITPGRRWRREKSRSPIDPKFDSTSKEHESTTTKESKVDAPARSRAARMPDYQRYDSSDLYKPRPIISSSRRRASSPSFQLGNMLMSESYTSRNRNSSVASDDNPSLTPTR